MLKIYKYYKYTKNKSHLKKVLIKKYGLKEGMKKYKTILEFHKKKQKVKKLEL